MNISKEKELFKLHADFCKFMGNPKRIEILFLLGEKERCVDELAQAMGISITNVSQSLAVMKAKSIVEFRRDGQKIYYRLSDRRILDACLIMRNVMQEQAQKKVRAFK